MPLPDGAASVFVGALQVVSLDPQGYVDAGASTFATANTVKLSINPQIETGDDIVIKGASGNIVVRAKHGDMPKYHTVQLELANPDPYLEQALAGGLLQSSTAAALGAPSGLAVIAGTTGGQLPAGTYGYRASQYNAFGESLAQNDVSGSVASGTTGQVIVECPTLTAGALGARIYGRTIGQEQLIGAIPNIGTQATSAASGAGAVTSLAVTALTSAIPQGTTFILSTDTNTPKIVFTTTAFAPAGVVTIPVSASASITTTIPAGTIIPVLVDTGVITPNGALPKSDLTGGAGVMGYQEADLGIVGNPNGVGLVAFADAYVDGIQNPTYPWFVHILPKVTGLHRLQRDLTNANAQTVYEGQAFVNPNFGSGPSGALPFDTSKAYQYFRCGPQIFPTPSAAPTPVAAAI